MRVLQSRRTRGGPAASLAALGLAAVLAVGGLAGAAHAQDGKSSDTRPGGTPLKIELNRLEPAGDNCRTYMLVDNASGPALKSLKIDLFAFDTEGVAQKRLAVELGPVQAAKTVVRLFDFPGIACPRIGRVLLNDVLACEGGDASRESCLERAEPTSKTTAAFNR